MLNWLKQNGRWMWVGVGLFAFCAHVLFVAETHTPEFTTPLVDAYAYHVQAVRIIEGKVDPKPFWQPPLFPYWLSLVYRMAGVDPVVARYVQGLWTVLAALLTFALARRLLPPRWAFGAGLLIPLYGPLLLLFGQLMPTGMAVALNLAGLVAFFRLRESPTVGRALLTGWWIGLAALAVPNALSFLPVAVGWALVGGFRDRTRRQAAFLGVSIIVGTVAAILPVACRNAVVSGEWVPISTNGGINLYIGNNPDSARTIAIRPGPDWDRLTSLPRPVGREVSPGESQRFFVNEVARYAAEQPVSFVRGLLRKAWHFVHSWELPRNVDIYVLRDYSVFLKVVVWKWGSFGFPFGVLLPLAVLGLVQGGGRRSERDVLLWFAIVYSVSVILFFPASRYRLPVIPALIVLAVVGTAGLSTAWKQSRRRLSVSLAAAAVVGGLVSLPLSFPTDRVVFGSELHNDVGVSLYGERRYGEALGHLMQAVKLDPSNAVVHCNLGRAMAELGDYGRAEFSCRRALQARPDYADARGLLGRVFCAERRYADAEECYRELIRHDAMDRLAWNDLGYSLLWQKRYAEAWESLRMALRVGGPNAIVMTNLGNALMGMDRPAEAVRCYRRALRIEPGNADIRRALDVAVQVAAGQSTP